MVYPTAERWRAAFRSCCKRLVVFYQPHGLLGPAVTHQDLAGHTQAELSRILNTVMTNCASEAYSYPINLSFCRLHIQEGANHLATHPLQGHCRRVRAPIIAGLLQAWVLQLARPLLLCLIPC